MYASMKNAIHIGLFMIKTIFSLYLLINIEPIVRNYKEGIEE